MLHRWLLAAMLLKLAAATRRIGAARSGSLVETEQGAGAPTGGRQGPGGHFALSALLPLSSSPGTFGTSPSASSGFRLAATSLSVPMASQEAALPIAVGVGWKLVVSENRELADSDLPVVLATIEGSDVPDVDDIIMPPEVAKKVFANEIGRVRLAPSFDKFESDVYAADLVADPQQQVMIHIMDTEDDRTTREVRARKALAAANGEMPIPGVLPALRIDIFRDSTFLVTPQPDVSLRDLFTLQRLSVAQVVLMAIDVLRGFCHLENSGIAYGAIKDANIVRKGGRWYITDFSQAHVRSSASGAAGFGSDTWEFLGVLRGMFVSGKVHSDTPLHGKLLALIGIYKEDRDVAAGEALFKLEKFCKVAGIDIPAAQALDPPAAWSATPPEQRLPWQQAVRPREDGEPLYPEFYETYVKPWGVEGDHDGA